MEGSCSKARQEPPDMCYFDEERAIIIHRFDMGECRCKCGKKIIRKPVKRVRMKFGKQISDSDFS